MIAISQWALATLQKIHSAHLIFVKKASGITVFIYYKIKMNLFWHEGVPQDVLFRELNVAIYVTYNRYQYD